MLKRILIFSITIYQIFVSSMLKQILGVNRMCRFEVTCSDYAKQMLVKYGIIRGGFYATRRLLSCHPF